MRFLTVCCSALGKHSHQSLISSRALVVLLYRSNLSRILEYDIQAVTAAANALSNAAQELKLKNARTDCKKLENTIIAWQMLLTLP